MSPEPLSPELLIRAYCHGVFPMARGRDGPVQWVRPDPRGVMPLEAEHFRVRRSLRKRVSSGRFIVTRDAAFDRVIRACAEPRDTDSDTWLSEELIHAYRELHARGFAHSVEAWLGEDGVQGHRAGELVGGLYGVTLGGAYFGESMFSRVSEASQVCLVKLVEHLRAQGFALLDVQFTTAHLEQFGAYEVSDERYMRWLGQALNVPAQW